MMTTSTNVSALQCHYSLKYADLSLSKSIKKLSSGVKIAAASDDPVNFSLSNRFKTQYTGLDVAKQNILDATSFFQTAESALNESQQILQKMRELSLRALNDSLTYSDRREIQTEIDILKEELDNIVDTTTYNGKKLLDGSTIADVTNSSGILNSYVTDEVVEGSYELSIENSPVDNHVIKSNIFKVKDGVDYNPGLEFRFDSVNNVNAGNLSFDFGDATNYSVAIAAGSSASDVADAINNDVNVSFYITASVVNNGMEDILVVTSNDDSYLAQNYTMTCDSDNCAGFYTAGTAAFSGVSKGTAARSETELWQLENFYDNQGNAILGNDGRSINIYNGLGDSASIYISPQDTLLSLAQKIENAIITPIENGGLGMGVGIPEVDGHVVEYVPSSVNLSDESVSGTFVIRSPWMGDEGKFYFADDERLIEAIGFATIQEAEPYSTSVSVTRMDVDPVTGAVTPVAMGTDIFTDMTVQNLIPGVNVTLDRRTDITPSWDDINKEFVFTSNAGNTIETVDVEDNTTTFQTGAYQGEYTSQGIPSVDSTALNLENVMVVNETLAEEALDNITKAIDFVSSVRAKIASKVSSFEKRYENTSSMRLNIYTSYSNIVDVDVAEESTNFAMYQLQTQTAQAILAQANKLPETILQYLL